MSLIRVFINEGNDTLFEYIDYGALPFLTTGFYSVIMARARYNTVHASQSSGNEPSEHGNESLTTTFLFGGRISKILQIRAVNDFVCLNDIQKRLVE